MFENKNNKQILFLGPKGSYTDSAKDYFAQKFDLVEVAEVPMQTIRGILNFIDLSLDKDILAVIPIENSIEGVVRETLDNLTRLKDKSIKIIAETVLPISHCLITEADSFDKIKVISSYPQGIAQCRMFIEENFQDKVKIRTSDSTAQAVRELKHPTEAAIASEKAALLYNKPVLARNINDEKDNKTRFVLIGREEPSRTNEDKTSITFSTENKPGALNKILNILEKHDINMSYIDSRPSKKVLGEYTFYIDFDGHVKDEKVAKALFEILQYTKFFRHIGSYGKV